MAIRPDALRILHDALDVRAGTFAEWPCRAGCDDCCRSLAEPPRIREAEWSLLRDGIESLHPAARAEVEASLDALVRGEEQRICPLLDRESGRCRVYEARPIACRAYGFYAARDGGRWCARIEEGVASGAHDGVVFGNHDALEAESARALGEARSLVEWVRDDRVRERRG